MLNNSIFEFKNVSMKRIKSILFYSVFIINASFSISAQTEIDSKGAFSLGARSTLGFFNEGDAISSGVGGQIRLQMSDAINTEWYLDYMSSTADKFGRLDYHIGWSVFYYYLPSNRSFDKTFQPFIEGGHCFDYTQVSAFGKYTASGQVESNDRWSSAVQLGTGTHINLTDRFDFTAKVQYMYHLGSDIHIFSSKDEHTHGNSTTTEEYIGVEEHEGRDLEGHLLVTFSVNYKFADVWKK